MRRVNEEEMEVDGYYLIYCIDIFGKAIYLIKVDEFISGNLLTDCVKCTIYLDTGYNTYASTLTFNDTIREPLVLSYSTIWTRSVDIFELDDDEIASLIAYSI